MSADIIARGLTQKLRGDLSSGGSNNGATLIATAMGTTVQAAIDGFALRAAIKALKAYDGARAYLRESGRQGTFVFRAGNYASLIAGDPYEGIHLASATVPSSDGAWVRQFDGHYNVRWWGAKGDNLTNDSIAVQAAMNAVSSLGGGTLFFPAGTYLFQNVELKPWVSILGAGTGVNGFSQSVGGTAFRHPASNVLDGIAAIELTAGGSGYTSAPTVVLSGPGSGATAVASVLNGSVVDVHITDAGSGYTAAPSVSFVGGGGNGAVATAQATSRLFFCSGLTSATALQNLEFSSFTMLGRGSRAEQGLYLQYAHQPHIRDIKCYNMGLEGIRIENGSGSIMDKLLIFACAWRNRVGYRTGAVRLAGTESRMTNWEFGADRCDNSDALSNCALYLAKTGGTHFIMNGIGEGGDIGIYVASPANRFVNVRADINYGHGWWLHRPDPFFAPPWECHFVNCWGHRNSRYATNTFDNMHIHAGAQIARTCLIGFKSSASAGDGWKPRCGIYSGASDTVISELSSDGLEATARYQGSSGNSAAPSQNRTGLTAAAATPTIVFNGGKELRITNGASPVTISEFTGGSHGDELEVQTTAANVTLAHGGTGANKMYLAGQQNRVLTPYVVARFKNMGGVWYELQSWARQPAISALAVTASVGVLPPTDGTVLISDAAAPTPSELLEYCREQDSKINALRETLRTVGLIQ